jgi:capsular polysaccharide biosynthesis protein
MTDSQIDLSWLFRIKFLKWLVSGSLVIFILTWIMTTSLLLKPVYRSETLIYVPLTLSSLQYEQNGIGFGSNAEIDGHIQILKSTLLYDSLDAVFRLSDFWNIDISSKGGKSNLYSNLAAIIKIEKTRYNSVSVTVRYHDAELAAAIANAVVEFGDNIKEGILFENRHSAYLLARELYHEKQEEISSLERRLKEKDPVPSMQSIADINSFRDMVIFETELKELTSRKNRYEKMAKNMETPLPRSYVISPAVAAVRPSSPPGVLFGFIAALAFVVVYIFVEIIRQDGKIHFQK